MGKYTSTSYPLAGEVKAVYNFYNIFNSMINSIDKLDIYDYLSNYSIVDYIEINTSNNFILIEYLYDYYHVPTLDCKLQT